MIGKLKTIGREIKKKKDYLADAEKKKAKDGFIEKFTLCEFCCKKLIEDHKQKAKKGQNNSQIKLHMHTIRASMKNIDYNDDSLKMIFSGRYDIYNRRGTYSAKNLRNSILHELNLGSMEEVFNRKAELDELMNSYLNLFISGVEEEVEDKTTCEEDTDKV